MNKAITLFLSLLLAVSGFAQSDSLSTKKLESKIISLSREIKSLQSNLDKREISLEKSMRILRDGVQDKRSNEDSIEEVERAIKKKKDDIGKFDLTTLEKSIKDSEKDRKSLVSKNQTRHETVAKYKGQVEALRSKIATLEGEIKATEKMIKDTDSDISEKQNDIESNGLVVKVKDLEELEKNYKGFQSEQKKIEKEVMKSEQSIEVTQKKIANDEKSLAAKKALLEKLKADMISRN